MFCANFFVLTWLGSCPAEPLFVSISLAATLFYFTIFWVAFV
jgi:hypothetical protein